MRDEFSRINAKVITFYRYKTLENKMNAFINTLDDESTIIEITRIGNCAVMILIGKK